MPTWESDPLVLKLRAGTISDPFVSLTESFIIPSGCKILLSELPDQTNKLTISGFSETSSTTPETDTFYCNYNTREVFFNDGNVGDSISISYWGRGLIYIPISSVYTLLDSNGGVLETLQETVDNLTNLESLDVWDNTGVTQYYKNNIVRLSDVTDDYNNSFFICIADVLSSTKPYLDITHWDFLVNMYDINIADHSASQALLWMGV